MSSISDYELEQYLVRSKMVQHSKEISKRRKAGKKFEIMELDPEVKSLDEYIMQLQRGEIVVQIPEDKSIDDYVSTETKLPELGNVTVYEPRNVSDKRMQSAYMSDGKSKGKDDSFSEMAAEFSIITLEDENGNKYELVVDKHGYDMGKIVYDKDGKPSFEMAEDLKDKIGSALKLGAYKEYVDPKIIDDEVYLKDINTFIQAIKEGRFDPEAIRNSEINQDMIREYSSRVAAAENIKTGVYSKEDAEIAVTLTPEEKQAQVKKEEKARKKVEADRLETSQMQRDKVAETPEEQEELDEQTKAVQTQPKTVKKETDEKEEKESSVIPEGKREEIKEALGDREDGKGISEDQIKAVLIIQDPSTLFDCTKNSNINRQGNEVTVLIYSTATGKEKYMMIQDGNKLGGDQHDDAFRDLIAPLRRTTGVVRRVEDNQSYIDYTDSTGELRQMQLKRTPVDMPKDEKEAFKERLEKDLDALTMVRANDPENMPLINQLELKVYQDFIEVGLVPPETIKEDAKEDKESTQEISDEPQEEEEGVDPRESRARNRRDSRY